MTDKRAQSSQLYTSSQVRELLGITPSTLTRLVDRGIIEKVIPPGRKQGYYTKKSVHAFLEQQTQFRETHGEQPEGHTAQGTPQME